MEPWKKSLNFIFPTKYVIPNSLKFSHWPSKQSWGKHLEKLVLAEISASFGVVLEGFSGEIPISKPEKKGYELQTKCQNMFFFSDVTKQCTLL